MRPIASITVDLDTIPHYRSIHGLDPRPGDGLDPTYEVGLQRLLRLFHDTGIRATLFVIGEDVEAHAELLLQAHEQDHELASHSFSHDYDLRHRSKTLQIQEFDRAEQALWAITGERPVGFRAPGYNIDDQLLAICAERGYLYDSSVFPCPPYYAAKAALMAQKRLRGRPSRSAMCAPQTLLAPIRAYRPARRAFWREDMRSGLPLEIPMCLIPGLRLPVIGTSLHLLGARGFSLAYPALRRAYRELLQLEFHTIDFMDADDPGMEELAAHQPDLRIPWSDKRRLYESVFAQIARDYRFAPLREATEAIAPSHRHAA